MQAVSVPPISPWSACRHLRGLTRWREFAKLGLRAALHPVATGAWLDFLNATPALATLASRRPRLVNKIYRPYHSNTMTCLQRVTLLMNHYRYIQRLGWMPLVQQAASAPVALAHLGARGDADYRLHLSAIEPMEREGELVLQLLRADTLLYSCAFTFLQTEQGMQLGIGCLQGPRGPQRQELVRTATRELYGLRPKHLLLKLLSALGHALGCQQLQLVSNRNRVVLRPLRQGKVHADYDAFWRDCGARPGKDGNFVLPCAAIAAPDLQDTPSHRRAAARQRHAVLSALDMALQTSLYPAVHRSGTREA